MKIKTGFAFKNIKKNYHKTRSKLKVYKEQTKTHYKTTKPTIRKIKKKSRNLSDNIDYYFDQSLRSLRNIKPPI